jgi:DNA-directed RNA polymerase specialized sigma24 family protein
MSLPTTRELARRIACLRPEQRDALLFVDILGLSPRNAAARAGVALPTLLVRLRVARLHLRLLVGGCA